MVPSRSQFGEIKLSAHESCSEPEQHEELEDTFHKLLDLLDEYAPSWYSDQLREEAISVLRHEAKLRVDSRCRP